jgi:L-arabinokinase
VSVVFYISGHGFGHASRQVEIINALGAQGANRIVIRSAVSPALLARTVQVPYALIPGECDSGVVQSTSVEHDDQATVDAAMTFYSTFPARVEAECRVLRDAEGRLVVGDIPPLAFAAAAAVSVPSVAIANFTWDWIYDAHPGFLPDGADVLEVIRSAYHQATRALELPFGAGFDVFTRVDRLPLVARRPTRSRAATRAHFGLPANGKVVLLSFGGYGMPSLDLTRVDCRDDWTVVTTDRTSSLEQTPQDGRVILVPESAFRSGFRYEDLVAAADAVLTKPGYGIIAECIAAGTPMLYTSRGRFREYDLLVASMPRYLRCRFVGQADLFAGRWLAPLEALIAQPAPPEQIEVNGAEKAAEILLQMRG